MADDRLDSGRHRFDGILAGIVLTALSASIALPLFAVAGLDVGFEALLQACNRYVRLQSQAQA
jgi:hypothetical protein